MSLLLALGVTAEPSVVEVSWLEIVPGGAPPSGFLAAWAARKVKVLGSGVFSMYPINAASPERLDVGAVVQISDGAVQTSGVSIKVKPQGGAAAAGVGTTTYEEGIVAYVPTQAETNYTSFQVIAYKTGCIPVAVTVITTASAVAGYAGLDWGVMTQKTATNALTNTSIASVSGSVGSVTGFTPADVTTILADTNDIQTRLPAALVSGRMDSSVGAMAAGVLTATAIAADAITDAKVAADVTIASVTGSVGSVTGLTAANLDVAVSTRMATYTQPTGFLAATFPGTVASTTNITAGTITTATNVTTVNGLAAGVITAASIAADAITDAKVAADVTIASVTGAVGSVTGAVGSVTGAVGSVTGNVGGNVTGSVASVVGAVGSVTAIVTANVTQISGDSTAADNAEAFFDGTGYAGTNNVIPTVTAVTGLTNSTIADQVWDEVLAGHLTAGTTGNALNAAGAAGDPWTTALPGAYGAGTAGKIIGDNIDATISSRATQTSVDDVPTAAENADAVWSEPGGPADDGSYGEVVLAVRAKTDNLPASPAAVGDIPSAGLNAAAVWDESLAIHTTAGSAGKIVSDIPTAIQNADALLGRNVAGGSSSGRVVSQALYALRNKWTSVAGTYSVYGTDDTTVSWTSTLATDAAAEPLIGSDPT